MTLLLGYENVVQNMYKVHAYCTHIVISI